MKNLFLYAVLILMAAVHFDTDAQESSKKVSLHIVPQNGKYLYNNGESAIMEVQLKGPENLLKTSRVSYLMSLNGRKTIKDGILELENGKGEITGTLDQPGFLRCDISAVVHGDTLRATCGCGFDVENIHASGRLPLNFDRFWREAQAELLRIPIDPETEEVEAVDPGDARRYKVSLALTGGSRVYGWLHLPEGAGPFPVVLSIPGSGVGRTGRFAGFTSSGIAVLAIEIHGLKPGRHEIIGAVQWIRPADEEIKYFVKLQEGILSGYHSFGMEDPYRYYHRRSLQAAMRALDYLYTRPDIDTSRVIVFGGSQGGGLSLLTAALDLRVDAVVATVPAFCDNVTGFHALQDIENPRYKQRVIRTMSYYDAALAAKLIHVPALIGVGFIDGTCPPANVYSAYNDLSGPKKIENFYTTGHGSPPGWRDKTIRWILENIE